MERQGTEAVDSDRTGRRCNTEVMRMSVVLERREEKTRVWGVISHGRERMARFSKARDQVGRNRDVIIKVEWDDE